MEFLYPQVLYGLFAVSIPIVIHLFNFRRYQKVWFNNVDLLKEIQKQTKKQSQLKNLLVLLMRILSIIMLVLAFSFPYFPNENSSSDIQETEYVSIYLDNSFSMTHLGENGSLLNEAQNMALQIIETYENKDRFQLITNQLEAKHFRWFNKMEIAQNIMEVEARHLQKDLSDVFQREKMLRMQSNPEIEQSTIYLLSDFQKNTSFNNKILADTNVKVRLLPLQNNPVNNLSIDSVYFRDPVQLPFVQSSISVVLSNNGTEDQNTIPLKLFIEDEQKAVLTLELEAGESKTFELSFTNSSVGIKTARIEIDDYPIIYDDRLYFSFNVRDKFNIAMISKLDYNPYLYKLYEEDSLINLQTYTFNSVDYNSLPKQDLVILNELDDISSGLQSELQTYIENGGQLLLIPGSGYNENQWLERMGCPRFKSLRNTETRLKEIDKQIPFFKSVFESQWSDKDKNQKIDLPRIWKYYSIDNLINAVVLLNTRSEEPLLVRTNFGAGSIYQLAFPLNPSYSELPEHALFVAVFNQMVLQSNHQSRLYETIGSGKPVKIKNFNSSVIKKGDGVIELGIGQNYWIPQMTVKRTAEIVLSQLDWPSDGIANAKYNDEVLKKIAVNYDRNESDFRVWTKDELSDLIADNNWPNFMILESSPDRISADLMELNETKHLWRWFLILGIFFIFVETMILRLWK